MTEPKFKKGDSAFMILPYIGGNIVKEVSITSDRCELTPGQPPAYMVHFYSAYGTSDWKYEKDLFATREEADFALYLTGNVSHLYLMEPFS